MVPNAAGTALEDENAARRILRATPSAAGPDVGLDGLRTGFGWSGDGFWATWGAFWRDLRPVGRDWRALEASGETLRMSRSVCLILGGQGREAMRSPW